MQFYVNCLKKQNPKTNNSKSNHPKNTLLSLVQEKTFESLNPTLVQ
jgi:hypothetical protein